MPCSGISSVKVGRKAVCGKFSPQKMTYLTLINSRRNYLTFRNKKAANDRLLAYLALSDLRRFVSSFFLRQ